MVYICIPSTWENDMGVSEVQSHFWLHIQFQSLVYMKLCLKTSNQWNKQKPHNTEPFLHMDWYAHPKLGPKRHPGVSQRKLNKEGMFQPKLAQDNIITSPPAILGLISAIGAC